ncbi:MAG: hypothetical protein EZS28_021883, partial [Streblomastix strix]
MGAKACCEAESLLSFPDADIRILDRAIAAVRAGRDICVQGEPPKLNYSEIKKKDGMKEFERLLAENQKPLIPKFDRNDKLQNDFNYPPRLKFNYDEELIRLSSTLHR